MTTHSQALRAPTTSRHLEELQRLVRKEVPPPAVASLVGFALVEIDLGRSRVQFDAGERHANPMGTLHGGILCDVGDAAMGTALATTLEDDESFTTLDLNIRFFKPIWKARLFAVAQVIKRTRQLGFIECDVTDERGALVARLQSECLVLRGDAARGR